MLKSVLTNLCLLFGSCAVGLIVCEGALRLFYPKYRPLADAQFSQETERIWGRIPNSREWYPHPDTGVLHALHHNNLALRQHRDFSASDLTSATNIGFFGDSYTENIRIAAPYAFTEPLDYLLNQQGQRFNVLNFGVDGYGPGQSFLHYQYFSFVKELDHVFFVFCYNDIMNIYQTKLFDLDDTGELIKNQAPEPSWRRAILSRLHTPYLIYDVEGRLPSYIAALRNHYDQIRGIRQIEQAERAADETSQEIRTSVLEGTQEHENLRRSIAIFRKLINRWRRLVAKTGGQFHAVLLPHRLPPSFITPLFEEEQVEVANLQECFEKYDDDYLRLPKSPYQFRNDAHWNEAGNRLAAICLYRFLEKKIKLPPLPEDELQGTLYDYYSAFDGWMSGTPGGARTSQQTTAHIRAKYLATDDSFSKIAIKETEDAEEILSLPNKRVIRSDFDVYLDGKRIVYVKDDCRQGDINPRFFLHVTPTEKESLPEGRFKDGRETLDFYHPGLKGEKQQRCVIVRHLPDYAIRHIFTGQYVQDTQGNSVHLWEGEVSMAQGAGVEEGGD